MRYWKWITALAAFLLLGFALNLGAFGWGVYSLLAIALLGRYRDMQARIAGGDANAALFTEAEVQAWQDDEARQADSDEDLIFTDQTHYPAGSYQQQMGVYLEEEGEPHPRHYKRLY